MITSIKFVPDTIAKRTITTWPMYRMPGSGSAINNKMELDKMNLMAYVGITMKRDKGLNNQNVAVP